MTTYTRNSYPYFPKPENVKRIWCQGDSMMYGAGVYADQTFPAHLGPALNSAFPTTFFEVVNYGFSSGTMWDSWSAIKQKFNKHDCDGIVFSICNNDAEAFGTIGSRYGERSLETWRDNSSINALLHKTFDDIEQYTKENNVFFLLFFYSFYTPDKAVIDMISSMCAERDIYFVDALTFLQSGAIPSSNQFPATRFDGHPSSFVHEQLARHITGLMKKHSHFKDLKSEIDYAQIPQLCVSILDDMCELGGAIDYCLDWANKTLNAKVAQTRRAIRRREQREHFKSEVEQAQSQIEDRSAAWYWVNCLGANVDWLASHGQDFYVPYENLCARLKALSELLVCSEIVGDLESYTLIDSVLPDQFAQVTNLENFSTWPIEKFNTYIEQLSDTFHVLFSLPNAQAFTGPIADHLAQLIDIQQFRIAPQKQLTDEACNKAKHCFTQIYELGKRHNWPNLPNSDRRGFRAIAQQANWIFQNLGAIEKYWNERTFVTQNQLVSSFLTYVDVTVRAFNPAISERTILWVEIHYDWPQRANAMSTHVYRTNTDLYVAQFALPLMIKGTLVCRYDTNAEIKKADLKIVKVEAFNRYAGEEEQLDNRFTYEDSDAKSNRIEINNVTLMPNADDSTYSEKDISPKIHDQIPLGSLNAIAQSLFNSSKILMEEGHFDVAIESAREALNLFPETPSYIKHYYMLLASNNQPIDALKAFKAGINFVADKSSLVHELASTFQQQEKWALVEDVYKTALAKKLRSDCAADYYFQLTFALHRQGRTHDAVEAIGRACKLDETCAKYHNLYGDLLRRIKRFNDSEDNLRKAIALDPESCISHYNLAVTLQELDNTEEAKKYAIKAAALPVDNPPLANTIKELVVVLTQ